MVKWSNLGEGVVPSPKPRCIKGKVEQSKSTGRRSSALCSQNLGVVAIEKGTFVSPSTKDRQLFLLTVLTNYRYGFLDCHHKIIIKSTVNSC